MPETKGNGKGAEKAGDDILHGIIYPCGKYILGVIVKNKVNNVFKNFPEAGYSQRKTEGKQAGERGILSLQLFSWLKDVENTAPAKRKNDTG